MVQPGVPGVVACFVVSSDGDLDAGSAAWDTGILQSGCLPRGEHGGPTSFSEGSQLGSAPLHPASPPSKAPPCTPAALLLGWQP